MRLTLSHNSYLTEGLVKNKCIRSLKIGKNMRQRTKYRLVAIKNIIRYKPDAYLQF